LYHTFTHKKQSSFHLYRPLNALKERSKWKSYWEER